MYITAEKNMWFPGLDYEGREGDYAKPAMDVPEKYLVALVQERATEDGEWAIKNDLVGNNQGLMREMMDWVTKENNIIQCFQANPHMTVDQICRDLANASKIIGGSRG